MEKLAKEKRSLESDFSDLKLTSKLAANRLDTLQKEIERSINEQTKSRTETKTEKVVKGSSAADSGEAKTKKTTVIYHGKL